MNDPIKLAFVEHLRRHMDARGLTQVQMAELLGISQPKVSALMKEDLRGFSMARLMVLVTRTGFDVIVRVKPRGAGRDEAAVVVQLP